MIYLFVIFFTFCFSCNPDFKINKSKKKDLNIDSDNNFNKDDNSKKEQTQPDIIFSQNKYQKRKEASLSHFEKKLFPESSNKINKMEKSSGNAQVAKVKLKEFYGNQLFKEVGKLFVKEKSEIVDNPNKIKDEGTNNSDLIVKDKVTNSDVISKNKETNANVIEEIIADPDNSVEISGINGIKRNEHIDEIKTLEDLKQPQRIDICEKKYNEIIDYLKLIKGKKSNHNILFCIGKQIQEFIAMFNGVQIKEFFAKELLIMLVDRLPKEKPTNYSLYIGPIKQIIKQDNNKIESYKDFLKKEFEKRLACKYENNRQNVYSYKEIFEP